MKEEKDFTYAHNDTSVPERASRTAAVNKFDIPQSVIAMRRSAFERGIPVSSDETLAFLCTCVEMAKPANILEIGTAVGVSGICMLAHSSAKLTTIEIDGEFAREAADNFEKAHMLGRASIITGDAADVLRGLEGTFDFVFLDGPKVQYVKYLPEIKRLLARGGVIFADDVLLFGWVNGEAEVPKKRRMLVEHIKKYIKAVQDDPDFITFVADVGDGVALSVKR